MKAIISIIVVLLCLKASSQTNEYRTILQTNWVKPGPYLRVVDGVTYNIAFSEKWSTFNKYEALLIDLPDMNDIIGGYPATIHRIPELKKTIGNASFFEIYVSKPDGDGATGQITYSKTFLKNVVVLNYLSTPPKGFDFYCMRTTDYVDEHGASLVCYDCGFPATNLVPVIKKVKVKF